ncbi:MAG: LemA family protein [Candidatus Eisenbacteria bacterium]
MIGWILLAVVVLFVVWLVGQFNGLVQLRNQVQNAWAQIDVQLKRRSDLIPNLVNTVKGVMKFEQETLEKVMNARARALGATSMRERGAAEAEVSQGLGRLLAVMENYPELKSNQNALQLQEEVTATENKVGFARQFYNDVVMKFNTAQQTFPGNLIAGMFAFKPSEFLQVPEADRAVPKVDLSLS